MFIFYSSPVKSYNNKGFCVKLLTRISQKISIIKMKISQLDKVNQTMIYYYYYTLVPQRLVLRCRSNNIKL